MKGKYWISPSGNFIKVDNHEWYARTIIDDSESMSADDVYNALYKKQWLHAVIKDNVLYISKSDREFINSSTDILKSQLASIQHFADAHTLSIRNILNKDILTENIAIDSSLKQYLALLYSYIANRISIKEIPIISVIKDKNNANSIFGFTGYYNPEKKKISLYIEGRLTNEILRSFAHECIHHWQNERGTLTSTATNKDYARTDVNLRKRECEAYLIGALLFRDWTDEMRYGPPQTIPFLPLPYD